MRPALLLDEMHSPVVAATLRDRGFDVVSIVEHGELRALPDADVYAWAGSQQRRIVTENVKDFAVLLRQAQSCDGVIVPVLFTSSRTFPRSRQNPGMLIDALEAWLCAPDVTERPPEDWLTRPDR